jgi:ADP-dependent NAD(P)H-hydrate dehydratase / NAD(P)H-hydrate epimerase
MRGKASFRTVQNLADPRQAGSLAMIGNHMFIDGMQPMTLMKSSSDCAVLTPAEMAQADALTIASGIAGLWLMENAGHAVKSTILRQYPEICRAIVLCGPGNNGGDGYVVARLLLALGIETIVHRSGLPKAGSDAGVAAEAWEGQILPLTKIDPRPGDIIIDAFYGAGFRGRLEGAEARAIDLVNVSGLPVVAIDLPSGLPGLTGKSEGPVIRAEHTVTFFRKKPAHLLYPGRALCGVLHVAEIGIIRCTLDEIQPALWENGPALFADFLPKQQADTHKYLRGHAGVFSGGPNSTGAARLAAMAAARAGAGAVTVLSPADALVTHAAHLTSVMLKTADNARETSTFLQDERLSSLVIGPAFGRYDWLREVAGLITESGVPRGLVLDADIFSAFVQRPTDLFAAIAASPCRTVLTPHQGEFERMFPDIAASDLSKVEMARAAARRSSAVIVYKGPDTVIAAPDGRAAISTNGGPELATAGSGDVLAGVIGGLLAQGMPPFEAACASVYIHGQAGSRCGSGLIAEDLVAAIDIAVLQNAEE